MWFLTLTVGTLMAVNAVQAHPGHDVDNDIAARAAQLSGIHRRDLSHCSALLKSRGIQKKTIERRSEILRREREKRGLPTDAPLIKARHYPSLLGNRDTASVLNTSHLSLVTYHPDDPFSSPFAGNKSCILTPEGLDGPYYMRGEFIREDLRERYHQPGIDLILDIQLYDAFTCDPVPNVMIDIWGANSTGVYSGVIAPVNGNNLDQGNINATFLRGLQPTGRDGVAQFITTYPGHYLNRCQHIHVAAHMNGTILPNNTYSGTSISHISQLYFDTDLSAQVEATAYYNTNTVPLTPNAQDGFFNLDSSQGDPVVEYSPLGEKIEAGVFGWISYGINTTRDETIGDAGFYGYGGGIALSNQSTLPATYAPTSSSAAPTTLA